MKQPQNQGAAKNTLAEEILFRLAYIYEGLPYRFKKGFGILDLKPYSLIKTNEKKFRDTIRDLNKQKFIQKKENYDGSVIVSLTEKGRLRALNIKFRNLGRKKENWDGKLRMVAFDIPNECVRGRKALTYRLRSAGFYEFQKSLFLYPYDCQKEISELVKLLKLEKYVRFALLNYIDSQDIINKFFKLEGGGQ